MRNFKRILSLWVALALLLTATGLSEELIGQESIEIAGEEPAEFAEQCADADEALAEADETLAEVDEAEPDVAPGEAGEETAQEAGEEEIVWEGDESELEIAPDEEGAPLPTAPEVVVAPEWEYDAEIGAITIPYAELPEALRFEWTFEGAAKEYAVQTAPVPEGDAPEVRGERIYTQEPWIELPAAEFAEGGWFSLYVTAVQEDGAEIEGWKYFRLEQREESFALQQFAGQSFTIGNVTLPFSLPTSDKIISSSGQIGSYNGGSGCWAFASYVYYRLFGKSFNRTDTSDFITTPNKVVQTTADNLKNLVLKAGPGAVIRVCSENYYNANSDGSGHSMVIVSADQNGAWIYHAAGNGQILSSNTINYYSWSTWASNCTNGKFTANGQYIKYIKYPGKANFNSVKPTSVTLDASSITRDYSQSAVLKATVSPASASQGVTWSTSNASVAKISATSGGSIYVWAINPGTATITCASTADSSKKASCTFKVNSPSTLQLTGVDYPSTYIINGNGYYLSYGTLASDVNLKSLYSVIKNSSGGVVGSACTQNLSGVKRYDIKGIDSKVPFSKITSEGSYTWTLTGTDVSGRSVTMNLKINAKKSGSRVISGAAGVYAPIRVSGISLSKGSVTLNRSKGETATLTATVSPSNASNKNVNWSTNNASVATVSGGKITPVGKGSATITCTAADGSGAKATCSVTVTEDIKVSGISLSSGSVTLNRSRGETATLTATVSPSNASNKNVNWSTNNASVATVSGGKITPVGKGSATITCTAADGSGAKATCSVTVTEDIKVSGISLSAGDLALGEGGSQRLTATVAPAAAVNRSVKWSSDREAVASVDQDGTVRALSAGSATITCAAMDGSGVRAECKVVVSKVRLREAHISPNHYITEGDTIGIYIVTDPAEAIEQFQDAVPVQKTDRSSAELEVDISRGLVWVHALSKGSMDCDLATDICTDSGERVVFRLTGQVQGAKKPKKVKIDDEIRELDIDEELPLFVEFSPEGAWSKLSWSSSNKKIATVDEDGVVRGIKAGSVTITAKAKNGGKKGTIKLKIVDPYLPTGVELSESGTVDLELFDELQLYAELFPDTAESELSWSSSNKKVATVDEDGIVTPWEKGTATITVKTRNGKKDSVKVNVYDPGEPVKIELEESGTIRMKAGEELNLHAVITPDTAADTELTWKSSNKKIASVDDEGWVRARKKGTATITVKAWNGKKDSVKIKVS